MTVTQLREKFDLAEEDWILAGRPEAPFYDPYDIHPAVPAHPTELARQGAWNALCEAMDKEGV